MTAVGNVRVQRERAGDASGCADELLSWPICPQINSTQTHTQTHTDTDTDRHTQTDTHRHTQTHTHTHTHTHAMPTRVEPVYRFAPIFYLRPFHWLSRSALKTFDWPALPRSLFDWSIAFGSRPI